MRHMDNKEIDKESGILLLLSAHTMLSASGTEYWHIDQSPGNLFLGAKISSETSLQPTLRPEHIIGLTSKSPTQRPQTDQA